MPKTPTDYCKLAEKQFAQKTSGAEYWYNKLVKGISDEKIANDIIFENISKVTNLAMAKGLNQFIQNHPELGIKYKLAIDEVKNVFVHDDTRKSGDQYIKIISGEYKNFDSFFDNYYNLDDLKKAAKSFASDGIITPEEKLKLAYAAYYNSKHEEKKYNKVKELKKSITSDGVITPEEMAEFSIANIYLKNEEGKSYDISVFESLCKIVISEKKNPKTTEDSKKMPSLFNRYYQNDNTEEVDIPNISGNLEKQNLPNNISAKKVLKK